MASTLAVWMRLASRYSCGLARGFADFGFRRATPALAAGLLASLLTQGAHAESILNSLDSAVPAKIEVGPTISNPMRYEKGLLLAQSDGDETYDPFSDYSEFEESADEEEDINFFRNGRMLTLGFLGGYRGFTQNLGAIYTGSPTFGLFLSYFFDLRFALQIGYLTSDHTMNVRGVPGSDTITGSASISDLSVLLKWYLNTQNVTRGLADLNPYFVVGFSQIYRTITITGVDTPAKDSAFGMNAGAGIEIPMMRNKMFFGFQANYQLVNFSDEGKTFIDIGDRSTGVKPAGDSWLALGILGVNF